MRQSSFALHCSVARSEAGACISSHCVYILCDIQLNDCCSNLHDEVSFSATDSTSDDGRSLTGRGRHISLADSRFGLFGTPGMLRLCRISDIVQVPGKHFVDDGLYPLGRHCEVLCGSVNFWLCSQVPQKDLDGH
jgi:hypothetical protein